MERNCPRQSSLSALFRFPEFFAKLLGKADAEATLYLALDAFTGLRIAELIRLEWHDIKGCDTPFATICFCGKPSANLSVSGCLSGYREW